MWITQVALFSILCMIPAHKELEFGWSVIVSVFCGFVIFGCFAALAAFKDWIF